jgi:SNF2 family DNA or RNA helicase
MKRTWGIDAQTSRLCFSSDGAGTVYPDVRQIFGIVFERSSPEDLEEFKKIKEDLPSLEFRPTLSFPVLRVSPDESGLPILRVRLNSSETELESLPEYDQVIVGDVWCPIDEYARDELVAALSGKGLQINASISAEDLAWLIWESELSVELAGDLEDLSNSLLRSTKSAFRPDNLDATLYDYQKSGAAFIDSMVDKGLGVLLADEMGLGKTIQAIYVIQSMASKNRRPVLVVVTAANLANWIREIEKFAPDLRISVHAGPSRAGASQYINFGDVLITTYQIVLRDVAFLTDINWSLILLDEAQNIKNFESKQAKAVCKLSKGSAIAITGTPIENSLSDVWSIFQFLHPTLLGTRDEFRDRFPDTNSAADLLSRSIAPFVVRRRVLEVADDLPERTDIFVPVFLSSPMNRAYSEVRDREDLAALPKVQALRQICAVSREHQFDSNKVDRLLELAMAAFESGDKAIVFASFMETIDLLARRITQMSPGIFVETLDGRKSPTERQQILDVFQEVQGAAVLIANSKAAGVGLNIQAANYVFHFNPEWNPALIAQASARAYRRGQTKNVFVYYLYYKGTVEEYVLEKLEQKQGLQDAGLGNLADEPSEAQLLDALRLTPEALEGSQTWN